MCLEEGVLQAYLDGEVTPEERATIEAQLAVCEECRATKSRLESDAAFAADALERLRPSAEVLTLPPVPRPAQRFGWQRMAAAAAAVVVVGSFAFGPVRTAAADFLRVFRVERIQTISVSADDLKQVQATLQRGKGHVDLKQFGEAWIDGGPREAKQVTLPQAEAAVGSPIRLPEGLGTPTLRLQPAQTLKFRLNVRTINDALRYYGSERTLPDSVDGKTFEIRVPAVATAQYGEKTRPEGGKIGPVVQPAFAGAARSPELVVPDGVDAAQLREVLLNLPFLPQNVRNQLASVNDWQSTLIVPNFGGEAKNVTIGGIPAVVMSPKSPLRDARSKAGDISADVATVVWSQDGVIHAIAGPFDEKRALSLAESCIK